MKLTQNNSTTVVREGSLTLTGDDIIALLWAVDIELFYKEDEVIPSIPKEADVTFTVPGGSDLANIQVHINEQYPIEISWSTTEVFE